VLGTKNVIVNSVKPSQNKEVAQGNTNLVEYGITRDDVSIIRQTLSNIRHVVPLKTVAYQARHGEHEAAIETIGTTPAFFDVVNVEIARGRALSSQDTDERTNVCVIGQQVREELFPFKDPLGESLLVARYPNAIPFQVVGILKMIRTAGAPARGVEQRNLNREILIPFSTADSQFGETTRKVGAGSREFIKMQYSGLYVTADDLENVLPISKTIEQVFKSTHDQEDYEIKVPLARLELAKRKARNKKFTLGFIAGISLLVGGIGIMNIMLATVTERTREIGIRRALGARQRHIAVQFLVETVVLSTGGGLIGVLLGVASAHLVSSWADWQTIVSLWSVVASFCLSVVVGIFFGMYPAMSAARLDPIEALRYE